MMHVGESRDPTIGAHLSSMLLADLLKIDSNTARTQFRTLSQKVWGYPEALEPGFENKAPVAVWSQNQHMLLDSLTLCDFAFPMLVRPFETIEEWKKAIDISGDLDIDCRFFRAVTGKDWPREQLDGIAEKAFNLERMLLARFGRSRKMEETHLVSHFKLPCRDDGTRIDEKGFSRLLDEYFTARGWDLEYGWPQENKLKELGLEKDIPALQKYRISTVE
jgi:aldehyde:ferredoxin oxidoreductase